MVLSVCYSKRALVLEKDLVSILPDSVPCAKVDSLFFLFDVPEPQQGNFGKTGIGAAGAGLVVVVVVVVVVMVTPSEVGNIWVFLLSFPQKEKTMYQFCSVSIARLVYFLREVCSLFNF